MVAAAWSGWAWPSLSPKSVERVGEACAVRLHGGTGGRGLRCPPISVARVGVACAVSRHVGAGGRGLFCLWAWTSLFIFGAKARRRGLPGTTVQSGWAWQLLQLLINLKVLNISYLHLDN